MVPQASEVMVQKTTVRMRAFLGSESRNIVAVDVVRVSVHPGLQLRTADQGIMKMVVV